MLIHSNKWWTNAILTEICPYVVRMACDVINESPNIKDPSSKSPEQILSSSELQLNTKHWETFVCPYYVLEIAISNIRGIHKKCKHHSQVGIYIGRYLQHAQNLLLILNQNTVLVSPQFHVKFNLRFFTVKEDNIKAHFQVKYVFF